MVVCLLPLVIIEILRMNPDDRSKLREPKVWANIVYCGVASSIWSGTFAVALDFSSVTQVYLLNNCQPILLVIWFKIKGRPISIFQAAGVAMGMVGLGMSKHVNQNFDVG
jgi:drug/metabolite transporter (DMT)-like permease